MTATRTKHHRCTVCNGVDYWHYVLTPNGEPMFNQQPGTKCWGPGQPKSTEQHVLSPDFTAPFHPDSLLRPVASFFGGAA